MTSGRVGSGALLGLSERTALESRIAFEKEKPALFERMNLEARGAGRTRKTGLETGHESRVLRKHERGERPDAISRQM